MSTFQKLMRMSQTIKQDKIPKKNQLATIKDEENSDSSINATMTKDNHSLSS